MTTSVPLSSGRRTTFSRKTGYKLKSITVVNLQEVRRNDPPLSARLGVVTLHLGRNWVTTKFTTQYVTGTYQACGKRPVSLSQS